MAVSQTQLVPASELAPGQIGAIRNQVIKNVLGFASSKLSIPADRFVIRGIIPSTDLDFTNNDWTETSGTTTNAYETITTGEMGDQRWVAIYGLKDKSPYPHATHIKFNIGGADRAIWCLEELLESDDFVGICPSGIIIPENDPYTLSRYITMASVSTQLVFKGVVIEPRGRLISP